VNHKRFHGRAQAFDDQRKKRRSADFTAHGLSRRNLRNASRGTVKGKLTCGVACAAGGPSS
jgi:hypothetical protein